MKKSLLKTTLAYIEFGDSYLMLYRNKKPNDFNQGKYLGIGGKLEKGESYIQAMKREIKEETGLEVIKYRYLGKIDFINTVYPNERMYLFKVLEAKGEIINSDEGKLELVEKNKLQTLPLWEGDKIFLPLLEQEKQFYLELNYDKNDLIKYKGPIFKE